MRVLSGISGCILGMLLVGCIADQPPEVRAPNGRIKGSFMSTRLGRRIYAFRGVRYAEPPVGQLRFEPPVPKADYDAFDASEEGPSCPALGATLISEDCLRLNVYTTKLPVNDEPANRSVLVFFHPGGLYIYSGQSFRFGPQYILDKDIVLVTVNYRLASLGFFSTGDSLAPGNLGLKDQVVALRWIQRNIAAFGGDPASVTISGYSIGGVSVMLHMLSPMTKGLFHRAIMMSGSLSNLQPYPSEQTDLAKKQAELLGCPTDTTGSMMICLKSKPVENFTATIPNFFEFYGDPMLIWKPVVEPEVRGVERFLAAQPLDLIRQGKIHPVPLICGVNEDEVSNAVMGAAKAAERGNDTIFRQINDNWETLAPISFLYERGTPRSRYVTKELRKFYLNDQPVGLGNYRSLGDIYADSILMYPMYVSAQLLAEYSSMPVYFYKFTYQGRFSFSMWNDTAPYGVVHHDDLQYLFYMSFIFPFLNSTDPEVAMVERYTSIVSHFAQTGEPLPQQQEEFRNVTWERYEPRRDNYLEINLQPEMKRGFFTERLSIWKRLFPVNLRPSATKH
uniref:Carboxylic ester hydrolase n=1 Tax=Ampulex compressa TaxID=860918 RepID=A0A1W6EW27_AMPCP|nr:carboxylic ester hydrolase [Ampulex compressa]